MKVKMLKNARGSENGYRVIDFVEGREYEIASESLASHFLSAGLAKKLSTDDKHDVKDDAESSEPKKAEKKKPADLENKMLKGSDYENKKA